MSDVVRIRTGNEGPGQAAPSPVTERALAPAAPLISEPVEQVKGKRPLYPRLLQLRHIDPNAWQRAVLGEGMAGVGALLAMADLASAWSIVALPVAVGVIVKAHDVLAGSLKDDFEAS